MLVCSVALRPKRGAIAATILERADALDTPALSVIFASISDNPGTASDTVSAFVGQNMVEAASAADVVSAGSIRNAAIVEETNALAVVRLPGPVAAAMTETAAAELDTGHGGRGHCDAGRRVCRSRGTIDIDWSRRDR